MKTHGVQRNWSTAPAVRARIATRPTRALLAQEQGAWPKRRWVRFLVAGALVAAAIGATLAAHCGVLP